MEQKLETLGIALPPPRPDFDNRLGAKRVGDIIYISGHPSDLTGAVGSDVSTQQAYDAARSIAIACLSTIRSCVGAFDDIVAFDKIIGFVRSAPDFTEQSQVINGASDLIVELFGDRGLHARSAIGVAQLPRGASVEIEMIVRVK